jgi:hypothetical protein
MLLALPRAEAQNPGAQWHLTPQPTLTIGNTGDPAGDFTAVMGAARLSSGDIVVANGRTSELRVFGSTGAFRKTISRNGEGPGEMRIIGAFGRSGDTLWVYDPSLQRLSYFAASTGVLTTAPYAPRNEHRGGAVTGRLDSGEWLLDGSHMLSPHSPSGRFRDTVSVGVMPPTLTGDVQWLGDFPGVTFFQHSVAGNDRARMSGLDLLGPLTRVVASGSQIWIGDSERPEIAVYDRGGQVVRRVTVPFAPATFTAADSRPNIPANSPTPPPARNAPSSMRNTRRGCRCRSRSFPTC